MLGLFSVLSTVTGGYLYYHSAQESALKETKNQLAATNEALKDDITRLIVTSRNEVRTLARFEQLQAALKNQNEETLTQANRVLDHFAKGLEYNVCYLIDSSGTTIATTNRDYPESHIGRNYSFRPYFRDAMQGVPSVHPALGMFSGTRGIYFSHPVYPEGGGLPIGVVVIKVSMRDLDSVFLRTGNMIAFLVHSSGMIFVSSRQDQVLNLLWRVPPEELSKIAQTKQFGKGPWNWTGLEKKANNKVADSSGEGYLMTETTLEDCPEWKLVSLYSPKSISGAMAYPLVGKTGYVALLLCFLVGGVVVSLYGLAQRDIRSRKLAEKALKESEARYRELFENASDLIYTQDLAGNLTSVNEVVFSLLGYTVEEFSTLHFRDVVDPQSLSVAEENYLKKVREGVESTGPYEILVRAKDGSPVWLEITNRLVKQDGNPVEIHGIARNITTRKSLEYAVREAQTKYQTVVEAFDGLIYICSQSYEVEFANRQLVEKTGFDPVGRKCFEALHDRDEVCPWCVSERVFRGETIHWDGFSPRDNRWYQVVNSPVYHEDGTISQLVLIQDITKEKKAEEEKANLREQLFQAQKMEAIGTLAGGIAHDFNNLLQVIEGYSQILLMNPNIDKKTLDCVNQINQAALNGAELVKGLLALGGKLRTQRKAVNLNDRVEQIKSLLSRTIPRTIKIEAHLLEDLRSVNADPAQIEQVLMNLAINARDAMPDGGKLIFETRNVTLDEAYCATHVEVEPGDYVLLSVSDTGHGMNDETAQHMFEPFFTTKEGGKGTGLGLAMAYGIVKQHGGDIRCYSEPSKGTIFNIYFPAMKEKVELSDSALESSAPGGTETILLADDDESIRSLGEIMLREMGYKVITAANGEEAFKIYSREAAKISLVILDLIMPEMDGQRCLEKILELNPTVKVLITSGYSEDGPTKKFVQTGAKGFVHKPYDVRQFLQTVRDVLDGK
jgi:PAS domain S-box-containing protein